MIRKDALRIGVTTLLAFIACNAYLAFNHLRSANTLAALTIESSTINAEISDVAKDVTDMETGQRGYLLTGNDAYLQPYTDAKGRIEIDLASLRAALLNRTQREQSLESRLKSVFQSKQAEMERSINLRQQGYRRRSFNLVDTDEGKNYMDEIRRIASSISSTEIANLARLNRDRSAALRRALKLTLLTNSVLLVLAVSFSGLMRRHVRLLGEEAAQSRHELAARDLQLKKLTSALSGQARSNITAINMNSRLLLENYGGFLPRQGHEYAEQVKQAATEMERLRQDLVGSPPSTGLGRAA
jgi:CHASE3 domain sensor protein